MGLLSTHAEIEELGGGRVRQTIGLKPIAYRLNGNLTRILNQIWNTGDPNLPLGTSELAQFRVRDKLSGNAPVVHFGKGQSHVRFTPLNTNNVQGQMVGENGYLYPNAWNNVDYLRLTIAGHIMHKAALLGTGHPGTFSFRLDSHQNFNVDTLSSAEFRVLNPILIAPPGSGLNNIPLTWSKSVQGGKTVLTVTLPAGDYAGWTLDPTVILQPDATAGKDAYIASAGGNATKNYGVAVTMNIGQNGANVFRSVIQFDLSSIPVVSTISSATFSLYCAGDASANTRTVRVFRLKRAWVEGTRDDVADDPATGVTWNRYDLTNSWQTAGGFGANDCEQTDIGSREMTDAETLNEFKAWTLTASALQAMLTGGSFTNNGFLVKADTETSDLYAYASSDNATAANRPKLVVVYSVSSGALYRRFMMTR